MKKYCFIYFLICFLCLQNKTHAQKGQINLEIENKTGCAGMEISPDGNYFLTRTLGATYLWSMNSGKKINEFFDFDYYNDQDSYAIFGPNSEEIWIFRINDFEEVKIDVWNMKTGEKTYESNLSGVYNVSDIKFNSKGDLFAINNGFDKIFICKSKTFKTIKTIYTEEDEDGNDIYPTEMEFTADDKHLIFSSMDKIYSSPLKRSASFYSIYENWGLVNWFIQDDEVVILSNEIDSLNNSKKYINRLACNKMHKTLGKELIELDEGFTPSFSALTGNRLVIFCKSNWVEEGGTTAFLFDVQTKELINKIPFGNITEYTQSKDALILVAERSQIIILNPETLEAKTVIDDRPSDLIAKFHPNKEYFFTLEEGILNSWYIENGEHFITHSIENDSIKVIDFFTNPLNGNLVYHSNNSIYYSSFPQGKLIQKTRLNTQDINQIQCSHSGDFFIVTYDSVMQFYDFNGALINDFIVENSGAIKNFILSPNDEIIAFQTDSSISLYDIESSNLRVIRKLESYYDEKIKSFNPSSTILVTEKFGYPINFLFRNTKDLDIIDSLEIYGRIGESRFLFSPDGSSFCTDNSTVFSVPDDFSAEDYSTDAEKVCLGDLFSHEEEMIEKCYTTIWSKYGYPISYTANGKHIYFEFANLIESRNSYSGYLNHQLNWHKGLINSFDILPDSRLIISTSSDGSLILSDDSTGKGLIKQFFYGKNRSDWAHCTEEGKYNASAGITNEIYWSNGLKVDEAIEQKSSMRNTTLWKEIITPLLKQDSIDLETKRVQEIYDIQNKELKERILKINKALTRETVTDAEGNSYPTVDIEGDFWMTENLATGLFNNGDSILEVKNLKEWKRAIDNEIPAYLIDKKNPELGKIYNGYAVTDPRGIAPKGMMVPGAKTSIHSSYMNLSEFTPDEIFLGKFVNSKGYNVDCFKSESTFIFSSKESDSAYFYSINSHGIWWFLNNSELSFCLSRCTGMDGEYFMGYGLDYTDTSASYGYGFYVRCVAPIKKFHNIKIAMESVEEAKYFSLYNKKILSDSLFNLDNLEYLRLPSCDLSEIDIHFNNLSNLKYLDLSGTNLDSLPNSIITLTKLEYLDLSNCSDLEIDFNILKELTSCKYIKIKDDYSHHFREKIIELRKKLPNCIIDTSF